MSTSLTLGFEKREDQRKSRKAVFWSKFQLIIKKVTLEFDKQWQVRKRVLNTQFWVELQKRVKKGITVIKIT